MSAKSAVDALPIRTVFVPLRVKWCMVAHIIIMYARENETQAATTDKTDADMAITLSPRCTACRCIIICDRDMVLRRDALPLTFADLTQVQACACASQTSGEAPLLFEEKDTNICVLGLSGAIDPGDGYERRTLRGFFAERGEEEALPYFRAKALTEWLRRTRFCPRCGARLQPGDRATAMFCPECANMIFPRIEPCVIMLVSRGNDILLALHRNRNIRFHSCLAGFIEAGESAEHAVQREIMEETGIRVRNIRYFGSQGWPFPSQLMLGFTAEYESGEIRVQEEELQSAAWFPRNACPATPPPGSLAYRLIHEREKRDESGR